MAFCNPSWIQSVKENLCFRRPTSLATTDWLSQAAVRPKGSSNKCQRWTGTSTPESWPKRMSQLWLDMRAGSTLCTMQVRSQRFNLTWLLHLNSLTKAAKDISSNPKSLQSDFNTRICLCHYQYQYVSHTPSVSFCTVLVVTLRVVVSRFATPEMWHITPSTFNYWQAKYNDVKMDPHHSNQNNINQPVVFP